MTLPTFEKFSLSSTISGIESGSYNNEHPKATSKNSRQKFYTRCFREYLMYKRTKERYKSRHIWFQLVPVVCLTLLSAIFSFLATNTRNSSSVIYRNLCLVAAIFSITASIIVSISGTRVKWDVKASKIDDVMGAYQSILNEIETAEEEGSKGLSHYRKAYHSLKHHCGNLNTIPDDDIVLYFEQVDSMIRESLPQEILSDQESKYESALGILPEILKVAYVTLDAVMSSFSFLTLLKCRYYPSASQCAELVEGVLQKKVEMKLSAKIRGLIKEGRVQRKEGFQDSMSKYSRSAKLIIEESMAGSNSNEDDEEWSWRRIRLCRYLVSFFQFICITPAAKKQKKKSLAKTYDDYCKILDYEKEDDSIIIIPDGGTPPLSPPPASPPLKGESPLMRDYPGGIVDVRRGQLVYEGNNINKDGPFIISWENNPDVDETDEVSTIGPISLASKFLKPTSEGKVSEDEIENVGKTKARNALDTTPQASSQNAMKSSSMFTGVVPPDWFDV